MAPPMYLILSSHMVHPQVATQLEEQVFPYQECGSSSLASICLGELSSVFLNGLCKLCFFCREVF